MASTGVVSGFLKMADILKMAVGGITAMVDDHGAGPLDVVRLEG